MNKVWFIFISGESEGPFAIEDLKLDDRLTPDTLVWKEGFDEWKKIRDVPELKEFFKESPKKEEEELDDNESKDLEKNLIQDELVLDLGPAQEPHYLLWLLLMLISLLYVILKLYN